MCVWWNKWTLAFTFRGSRLRFHSSVPIHRLNFDFPIKIPPPDKFRMQIKFRKNGAKKTLKLCSNSKKPIMLNKDEGENFVRFPVHYLIVLPKE